MLERRGHIGVLELRPVTGRTHQLRVHCAYQGFPILGDPQYGTEESIELSRELGCTHQMLCAGAVELTHPVTGEHLVIRSGLEGLILGGC